MESQLNITVKDSVFDPNFPDSKDRKIHVHTENDLHFYKVWLFLDGRHLPYVRHVTYTLHPTFPDPVRIVRRTLENPNCQLILWTWGFFTVQVTIEDMRGGIYEMMHELSYGQELAQARPDDYKFESDVPSPPMRPQFRGIR